MNKRWHGSKDGVSYAVHLDGIKYDYFANAGSPEKPGGGSLLPRHFFKQRWQKLFSEVFNKENFDGMENIQVKSSGCIK